MLFMMNLGDSLSRSKEKWKKRLGIGSEDKSSSPSMAGSYPGPTPPFQRLQSTTLVSDPTEDFSHNIDSDSAAPVSIYLEKPSGAWTATRSLLTILESSTNAFGPLNSAISGLKGCIDIYEQVACKERKDYEELGAGLKEVLQDLADHMEQPTGLVMTNSVRRIYNDIVEEAKRVTDKQARTTGRRLIDALEGSVGIVECYRRIDGHLRKITLNASMSTLEAVKEQTLELRLNRMSPHTSATYDSAESLDVQRGGCTSGTRKTQIRELIEWANIPDSGRICWMNGMAGTGKTTIAYTVCKELEDTNRLGASFFCSRAISECRQVKHIIPSIAYQLAAFSRPFRCALAKVMEVDRDAHTRALNVQYQKLIVDPLNEVKMSLPTDFIVVIDALDECESLTAVEQILELLLSTAHMLPIRFLISSRPEREITGRMAGRPNEQDQARLVLHNLDSSTVKADIELYMREELKGIPLTDSQWTGIIDRCGVLFIYASTTCRYIKNAYKMKSLNRAVGVVINSDSTPMEKGNEHMIDKLYRTILDIAFGGSEINQEDKQKMKEALETAVCAIEPMSLGVMANLLGLDSTEDVDALLGPLRSVLNVTEKTRLVTTLHASFPDFMLSLGRSGRYHCQANSRNATIAESCLKLIDAAKPRHNICALASSFLLDEQVKDLDQRVTQSISPGLAYACRYWTTHLSLGEHTSSLTGLVGGFFRSRLLLWMEVMNLTKNMRYATYIIQSAERCFITGAKRNQTSHRASSRRVPVRIGFFEPSFIPKHSAHLHLHASVLAEISATLSRIHAKKSGLVQPIGTAIDRRQLALIATWKVSTTNLGSISLSGDGRRLVAPTADSIDVYDTTTGESVLSLVEERTKNVHHVAISLDGSKVAFSSLGGTPYVWDTAKGGVITQLLADGVSGGRSLAFSPDGSHVACGLTSGDVYICALDKLSAVIVRSRAILVGSTQSRFPPMACTLPAGWHDIRGHAAEVWSVCFGATDSHIALGSLDKTIQVWDPQTGETVLGPLTGHSNAVCCVAFSPNGAFIASGSTDKTIRVYETRTGQTVLGPLEGHAGYIYSVIFSPDSTRLFSCSADGTVRIWNVQDIDTPNPLPIASSLSSHIYSIRYSRSGTRVVSGSEDGSVHVWHTATGQLVLGPLRGHEGDVRSVDYSADDRYIASGSYDSTLRIWDGLTGKDMHGPMKGHGDWVNCVRFSPDSTVVVSGSSDRTVRIWDVNTGQQVTQLFEGDLSIRSVGISPDGHRIVCDSDDGKIVVLDRHSGTTVVGPIDAHKDYVRSVEFSLDAMRLVSGSNDKSVGIWDAETGKQLVVCGESGDAHGDYVLSVSFSPNGLYVASGSRDRTVRVWDSQNGKPVHGPLMGHTGDVQSIQFSPDGSHLASCSWDRTIRFWDISSYANRAQGNSMISIDQNNNILSASDVTLPDSWLLDDNGWIVDSHGQRLVWVPPDLRTYLQLLPNSSMIADQGCFRLDMDGWNIGDNWSKCYQP
ncbi:ribosomal large subunit assembly [Rhizoctonia solani]|uniref:Ribosomal large subunit assembly n=1 Tax=Rhizoctonia solani TaxID=456999 RepID=A0A8H7LZB1_9AGAM|nr:ribosomal large subunit assembly [Rhizoctonia solani]